MVEGEELMPHSNSKAAMDPNIITARNKLEYMKSRKP